MYILQCWMEHPVRKLDQTFTYLSDQPVKRGCRISAGFGKKTLIAFVDSAEYTEKTQAEIESEYGMKLRFAESVIDESPLITDELYEMAMRMREATLSTAISCFSAMLPAKIKPASGNRRIASENWVELSEEEVSLTPKQLLAYTYVKEHQPLLYSELRKLYPNAITALRQKNAIRIVQKEKRGSVRIEAVPSKMPQLSSLQNQVLNEIRESENPVCLLRGITGSGKTEIYLRLAQEALSEGRQVLILVPEIALTPQMIDRVSSRFGKQLAIYHSGLNPQEKYEQYRRVMDGDAAVVVGTRSAVFLPFENLGLIVMDEEHDPSYKQDSQPCYHCRDAAIWRAHYHHCKLILASATPSLDSYARGLKGVYHLVRMDERISSALADVTVVPMKESIRKGQSYIISDVLKEKIQDRLDKKEQVILLLNRRGYHTKLRCRSCQEVIRCPHCDLSMSWHRDSGRLKCHTCGAEMPLPRVCPSCGSAEGFAFLGYGTEKLEQEIRMMFPSARILRMDADTTARKNSHAAILKAFENHEADILMGTQMIAKGLDYPDVTLVGVINGDEGLSRTDYRSCETTFDLLMQASGRSGRGGKRGEAVFQVFDPAHYAVVSAAAQDYETFFTNEMHFRHAGQYPPYTYLISLTVSGTSRQETDRIALNIRDSLHGEFKIIGVIGLLKIRDLCRSRILLKGKDLDAMRQAVKKMLDESADNLKGLRIDVNPLYLD